MLRILIAESLHIPTLLAEAEKYGLHISGENLPIKNHDADISLNYQPDITPEELPKYIANFSGLVVRPKAVNAECLAAAKNLRLIVRGGSGLNSIDLLTAKKNGVIVENTPGENSISTAEYSFGLLWEILADRKILRAHNDISANKFLAVENYSGRELYKKSIALIGFGAIGREMAKRCLGFGMRVRIFSRSLEPKQAEDFGVFRAASLEELLAHENDAISLHIPLTPETDKFLTKKIFSIMPDYPAVLINAARPQLIDPEGLEFAVSSRKISRFAIDGDADLIKPFMELPSKDRGLFTHHIADTTTEAQANITRQVLLQIVKFFRENVVINSA